MAKRIEPVPLAVTPADWRGGNTFGDRAEASQALLAKLREHAEDDVVVVAHSHGGSAVHYAYASDPAAFLRVRAVICMSTPFFGFSLRPGYEALLSAAVASLCLFAFQILVSVAIVGAHQMWHQIEENVPVILAIAVVAAGVALLAGAWMFKRRGTLYRGMRTTIEPAMKWDTTSIRIPRSTYVRSMGDEVAFSLGTLQFWCSLANGLLQVLAGISRRLYDTLSRWWLSPVRKTLLLSAAAILLVASALPAGYSVVFGSSPRYWIDLLWMWNKSFDTISNVWAVDQFVRVAFQAAITVILTLECLAACFFLLFVTALAASSIALRSLGAWSVPVALAMQFAVEPTPEGRQTFINVGWERRSHLLAWRDITLQHSDPYLSETAVEEIGNALAIGFAEAMS